jgi:hypothetical protein
MQLREREVFVTISWTLTHCVMMQQVDETPADSAFVTAMALLSVGAAKRCQSDKALSGQGTADLQASTGHHCHGRMAMLADPLELEGVRSVGAVKWC